MGLFALGAFGSALCRGVQKKGFTHLPEDHSWMRFSTKDVFSPCVLRSASHGHSHTYPNRKDRCDKVCE